MDWNLRWNIHINDMVMRLRSIIFKINKLNKILPKELMCAVYNALDKSIFQYGLIVRGGCTDNALRPLITQQNLTVRICPNKKNLVGSSVSNYKELKTLPIRFLYKQFAILWVSKQINFLHIDKRKSRAYDVRVNYTKKNFGKHFLDYLGLTYLNAMPLFLKKKIFFIVNKKSNYLINKNSIVKWLLSEL